MPLTRDLDQILLTHPCPHCGHGLEKTGRWFTTAAGFRCGGCGVPSRITYDIKLRLWAVNAHLAP
ncbi:MAG: hypothetical protein JWO83_4305 [Caulobacteraceae bacterium]|nr:hypothetical protein [Caulobacteraceae bacterium]